MPGSLKARIILESSSTRTPKKFFQSLYISEQTSDTLNLDESHWSSSMFVSLEEFEWHCMYSNAASFFILLQMFRNFFMLLSTGNITLCENKVETSEMTKKVSIRLFSFLMKITVYKRFHVRFTHDEWSKMYFTLMSLDELIFPGRKRDFYTKYYRRGALRKL